MEGMMNMIPTRDTITTIINSLDEERFKMVAVYVNAISEENIVASPNEIADLTKHFNKKYENAFRKLAQ